MLRVPLAQGAVLLELDAVPVLSFSFLDGLVLEALAAGTLDALTLVTAEPRTQEKLARLAALHPAATLYATTAPTVPRTRVVPAALSDDDEPVFETSKGDTPRGVSDARGLAARPRR
ncbi:MAG TPA: hypothetical protein VKW76_06850 [Candidatus Binatia bacterium]|nr:hypothetical protein [Candidatus Binatia bacterium]